jgi:hypothetical protein
MQFLARHVDENAPSLVVANSVVSDFEVRGTETGPGSSTDQVHELLAYVGGHVSLNMVREPAKTPHKGA